MRWWGMKLVLEIFGIEVLKVFKNDWEKCLAKLNFGHGKFGHDLVHGPMRFLPWAVHFEPIYLSIGWLDEKTFNIKVVEEVAINKTHVDHFFIWSFYHGVIGSGTLEKHEHQVFVQMHACWLVRPGLAGPKCLANLQLWMIITLSILIQMKSSWYGFEARYMNFKMLGVDFWIEVLIWRRPAPKLVSQVPKLAIKGKP